MSRAWRFHWSPVAPIVFRRLPEPEMATRNEAATERLLARHGSIFGFADSEFFRIEFRRNAAGQVDGLLSHEPTGTYLAERDAAPH
jgi:hypothetical protein